MNPDPAPADAAKSPAEKPFPWRWCLLAVAVAIAVHARGLGGGFVYDDRLTVVENPSIRGFSSWLVTYSVFRPLVNVSYALDHALWGLSAAGYHVTDLLLHALNSALLFLVAWRAGEDLEARGGPVPPRIPFALVPALLFAAHPLLTEAVHYVSARSELLCATFSLLSLLAFRRAAGGNPRWVAAAFATLLCGLASKEVAASVPVLAWLWQRLLAPPGRKAPIGLYSGPFVLVLVAGAVRVWVYLTREAGTTRDAATHALAQLEVSWRYFGMLLAPVGQTVVHEFDERDATATGLAIAAVALIVLVFLGFRLRKRFPVVALGGAWWLFGLLPSAIVPLTEPMAEHRTYFASAGLFLAFAEYATRIVAGMDRSSEGLGRLARGVGIALFLGLCATTVVRAGMWSDPVRLWADAAEKSPRVYGTHYEYANALRAKGDCTAAIDEYHRAIERVPDQAGAWTNLGICLAQTKNYPDAEIAFRRVVVLEPQNPQGPYNLGMLAELRGDRDGARKFYEDALKVAPDHALAKQGLARVR